MIHCFRCGKPPEEIGVYVSMAADYDCTPEEYVRDYEGTFNRENEHFACDECYITIGMPSSESGWKAP